MFLQRLYLFAVNSHILKLAAFNSFLFAHEARFAKEITVNTSKSDKLMFNETSHTQNNTWINIFSQLSKFKPTFLQLFEARKPLSSFKLKQLSMETKMKICTLLIII